MTIDSISDMATIIRNAITIKNSLVTLPYTKNNEIIAKILAKEGFIHCVTTTNKTNFKKNEKINSLSKTPITQNNTYSNDNNSTQNENIEKNEKPEMSLRFEKTSLSSEFKNLSNGQKVIILALKYVGREKKPLIHAIKRISKPSLRWYSPNPIPQSLGGLGVFLVSTSFGIITDKEARDKRLGGEILLEIW